MSTNAMSNEPAAAGNGAGSPYTTLDRRSTVLETRFDTILPALSTKQDLAELRADLLKALNEHLRWTIALFAMLFIGMLGANYAMWNSMERILEANLRQSVFYHSGPSSKAPPANVPAPQPGLGR